MEIIRTHTVDKEYLKGRIIQKCVGAEPSVARSEKMTVGYARYCEEVGPMEPHNHAEETLYIVSAKDAWVRFGQTKENLNNKVELNAGDFIHIPELEWHVFEYLPGGHLDVVYIYGQVDNIRPEDN